MTGQFASFFIFRSSCSILLAWLLLYSGLFCLLSRDDSCWTKLVLVCACIRFLSVEGFRAAFVINDN
jgi:hypothetical protein